MKTYYRLTFFAAILALIVVVLGAYTRLGDAGLGCPDWPGCYGQLTVPRTMPDIIAASVKYPDLSVEPAKAWKEMVHRYVAGTLGTLIFALAAIALWQRKRPGQPLVLPLLLIPIVLSQAVLGMWTVTWKLLPLIVMAHLLGGFTILMSLWWLVLRFSYASNPQVSKNTNPTHPAWFIWAIIAFTICCVQVALGGWTGANYAALACPDFPFCRGELIPHMDFARAFNFFSPIGANYEGGLLDAIARATINTVHRFGGLITGIVIGSLSISLMLITKNDRIRWLTFIVSVILFLQIGLGILNITAYLPLPVAVAHNGVAALLLLSLLTLIFNLRRSKSEMPHGQ